MAGGVSIYGVACRFKVAELSGKFLDGRGGESRRLGLARVPPGGKRALRVGVDEHRRALAGSFGGNGEVSGDGALADTAFLVGYNENVHFGLLPSGISTFLHTQKARKEQQLYFWLSC
jgi:hypothetical protein